jgi:copper transport protein
MIAPLDGALAPGAYRVIWRVVSADGHPVEGSYVFHVAAGAGSAAAHVPAPPPPDVSTLPGGAAAPNAGPSLGAAPLLPSLLRGLGLGALMVLGGLLFFVVGERTEERPPERARRLAGWLSAAAPLLLAAHFLAWVAHTSPTGSLDGDWLAATAGTTAGHVELARVALAVLVCWALLLARRPGVALAFAAVALTVSGGVGHPAAIHPAWAVPAKAVHLLTGALWTGGVAWLLTVDRDGDAAASFAARADRVSAVALWSVVAVSISGVVQGWLFLAAPIDLVRSLYGVVLLAKVVGLLVLVGFGAYHRKRVIDRLRESAAVRATFARMLGGELAVMVVVILLGGLLAYLAPPMHDMTSAAAAAPSRLSRLHERT